MYAKMRGITLETTAARREKKFSFGFVLFDRNDLLAVHPEVRAFPNPKR